VSSVIQVSVFSIMAIRLLLLAVFITACFGEDCRRYAEKCWANNIVCCPDHQYQGNATRYRLDCNEDGKCYTSKNPPVPCIAIAPLRVQAFWMKNGKNENAHCDWTAAVTQCDYDLEISLCDENTENAKCGRLVNLRGPDDTTDWKLVEGKSYELCAPSMEEFKEWDWIKFRLWDRDSGGRDSSKWYDNLLDKDDLLATSWHKMEHIGEKYVSRGKCAANSDECSDTEITFSLASCNHGMVQADEEANQELISSNICYFEGVPTDWPKNLLE